MKMKTVTNQFSTDDLRKIDQADDLKISPFRADGSTYGTPVWIWEVIVNGELYVRAYNGQNSSWYQAAVEQKAGRIHAAGMVKQVVFEPVGIQTEAKSSQTDDQTDIQTLIDQAYRDKYSLSPYLSSMIGQRAKTATVRISPKPV